jgi:cytochrome P450
VTLAEEIDLCDLDRFAEGFPHAAFARLRREAPVWFHPPCPRAPGGEGFWVVSGYPETLAVLRDPERFSSESGPGRQGGGTTLEDLPVGVGPGVMLNMMDPPRHTVLRQLVNRGFQPRTIARLEADLRQRTRHILDAVAERGRCDFVREVAAELPLQVIAGLLGVPQSERHRLFEWTTAIVDYADRELGEDSERLREAGAGLAQTGRALIAEKRRRPADDLLSTVIHGELPDAAGRMRRLVDAEILAFFSLLFVAGSETTRNAIAHGLLALIEHPEELARLERDRGRLPGAVEEILRWTSPTAYNRRSATRDVELGGMRIRAGQKVTHWYPSANRDERVFPDAQRFDVGRVPNPHLAFGLGAHHCLGATLARTEVRVMYEELLDRFTGFELDGAVEWARSNKHTGIRRLPLRFRLVAGRAAEA